MARRFSVERIERDDDDDTGQTVRGWHISKDDDHIIISAAGRGDCVPVLLIRQSEIELFEEDLAALRVA